MKIYTREEIVAMSPSDRAIAFAERIKEVFTEFEILNSDLPGGPEIANVGIGLKYISFYVKWPIEKNKKKKVEVIPVTPEAKRRPGRPRKVDPMVEPAKVEPIKAESAKVEPVKAEPAKVESEYGPDGLKIEEEDGDEEE